MSFWNMRNVQARSYLYCSLSNKFERSSGSFHCLWHVGKTVDLFLPRVILPSWDDHGSFYCRWTIVSKLILIFKIFLAYVRVTEMKKIMDLSTLCIWHMKGSSDRFVFFYSPWHRKAMVNDRRHWKGRRSRRRLPRPSLSCYKDEETDPPYRARDKVNGGSGCRVL